MSRLVISTRERDEREILSFLCQKCLGKVSLKLKSKSLFGHSLSELGVCKECEKEINELGVSKISSPPFKV